MILTVASYKGGVGKTTTAVHLAAYLNTLAPALLLDGDITRNATAWSKRGDGFPFRVARVEQAAKLARDFAYTVIDTSQRPTDEELQAAAEGSDVMIVPAIPSALDTDGLGQTIRALQQIPNACFRVLLTRVAPDATREVDELRELLRSIKAPILKTHIPRLKAFEKAAGSGMIVNQVDDRNAARAWAAYAHAGKELLAGSGR